MKHNRPKPAIMKLIMNFSTHVTQECKLKSVRLPNTDCINGLCTEMSLVTL